MNRIEQYIRSVLVQKRLLEQHLIEDDKPKKYENDPEYDPSTGYIYKIPKTTYGKGDLERLRVHFVDKAAQENGAVRGFLVVAIHKDKTKKPTYDQMISAIADRMAMDSALSDYYGYSYRIVVSIPKGTDRRKVFAVWIVDVSYASPLGNLLDILQSYLAKNVNRNLSFTMKGIQKLLRDETDESSLVMTQPVAIQWTTSLNNVMKTIQESAPDWWKQNFPNTRKTQSILGAVPDFKYMNRIDVEKFQSKQGDAVQLGQLKLTPEILARDYGIISSFEGTGIIEADPISGKYSLIPVNGNGTFKFPKGCTTNCRLGQFQGDFKSGAYYDGTLTWDLSESDKKWDITKFIGKVKSYVYEEYDENFERIETSFSWELNDGDAYYYKDVNDAYGFKFSGTFEGKVKPRNGVYYERKDANSEYIAIGETKNGKYNEYAKPVTYPYTAPNGLKVYTQSEEDKFVYTYASNEKKWYVALKSDHAKQVNKTMTDKEFISKLTTIEDPADVDKFIKLFNPDINTSNKQFVTIKSNVTKFKVYKIESNKWQSLGTVEVTGDRKLEKLSTKDTYTQVDIPNVTSATQQTWVETSILE